jgi:hypothetical protein
MTWYIGTIFALFDVHHVWKPCLATPEAHPGTVAAVAVASAACPWRPATKACACQSFTASMLTSGSPPWRLVAIEVFLDFFEDIPWFIIIDYG